MATDDKEAKRKRTLAKMAESDSLEEQVSAAISYASASGESDPTFRSVLFTAKEKAKDEKERSSKGGKSTGRSPVIEAALIHAVRTLSTTESKRVVRYLEEHNDETNAPLRQTVKDEKYIVFVENEKLCRKRFDGSSAKDGGRDISLSSIPSILTDLKKAGKFKFLQ
ncbi:MAG: hypothetical protein ABW140_10705 [Candidatus Sedimenticola sp. 6PFRAG1]